jgi:hypothetical protein
MPKLKGLSPYTIWQERQWLCCQILFIPLEQLLC